mmetsp:Transcript_34561/g.75675  ORF Transcript_34561/g.75675 Transcript_34561/m.75675 type:complete len:401 (-) Transcript_34561:18-1220(-)
MRWAHHVSVQVHRISLSEPVSGQQARCLEHQDAHEPPGHLSAKRHIVLLLHGGDNGGNLFLGRDTIQALVPQLMLELADGSPQSGSGHAVRHEKQILVVTNPHQHLTLHLNTVRYHLAINKWLKRHDTTTVPFGRCLQHLQGGALLKINTGPLLKIPAQNIRVSLTKNLLRSATHEERLLKQPLRKRRPQHGSGQHRPGTLPANHYRTGVQAELGPLLLHPLQRCHGVPQAQICGHARQLQPSQRAETIVGADHGYLLLQHKLALAEAVEKDIRVGAKHKRASMEEDEHRKRPVTLWDHHIQVQTLLFGAQRRYRVDLGRLTDRCTKQVHRDLRAHWTPLQRLEVPMLNWLRERKTTRRSKRDTQETPHPGGVHLPDDLAPARNNLTRLGHDCNDENWES